MSSGYLRSTLAESCRRLGFSRWYDFSHKPTFAEKLETVIIVLVLNILWFSVTIVFLRKLAGTDSLGAIQEAVKYPFIGARTLSNYKISIAAVSQLFVFFTLCVVTPLWEEVVFRVFPVRLARGLELVSRGAEKVLRLQLGTWRILGLTVVFSSILFGLAHGSIVNILIQGVVGLCLFYVYIKNGGSYWSVVLYHALWNINLAFYLPWLTKILGE